MRRILLRWLPELCIAAVAFFFIFRDLGTFPDAWADDSLFMIVARSLAEGRGYALPVLSEHWRFPFILGVGPPLIVPSALFIKIFGFSVFVARIPMTLYLLGSTALLYVYTNTIAGRSAARWATALLITLSAFVNTGKPVLGEVPAFFFLLLGLLALRYLRFAWAGILIGIVVVTKLSYGMVFVALGCAGISLLFRQSTKDFSRVLLTGLLAGGLLFLWLIIQKVDGGMFLSALQYHSSGSLPFTRVLTENPALLLRFPFLYFGALFMVACIGWWKVRTRIPQALWITHGAFILCFVLYFLNGEGWYRHILPAHMALLPFVPVGMSILSWKKVGVLLMALFVGAQCWWQYEYRGSILSDEAELAAAHLQELYAQTALVIREPEIFVRVMRNTHWLFSGDELARHGAIEALADLPLTQEQHCLPELRKVSLAQQQELGREVIAIERRFVLVMPPEDCVITLP